MTDEIKIDHGMAVPKERRNRKYPWHQMKKGDSFFTTATFIQGPAHSAARTIGNGCKFICRSVTEKGVKGIRVWRIS